MRLVDPYALKLKPTRETIIFAASQRQGDQPGQEDYFLNFNDECFVLADGIGFLPHGDEAAKFACETAIWAFKHVRQHRYYWLDKKLFMKRIFRTTNMAVWQKRKEVGFEGGSAANFMVTIFGRQRYWLGAAGDSSAWILQKGVVKKLTPHAHDFSKPQQVLGNKRLGLIPLCTAGTLASGDVLIMTSAGCGNYLTPADLQTGAISVGNTVEEATRAVVTLLDAASKNGSRDNMTAVIIKRVSTR